MKVDDTKVLPAQVPDAASSCVHAHYAPHDGLLWPERDDVHHRPVPGAVMARPPSAPPARLGGRLPHSGCQLGPPHLAPGLHIQKRQRSGFPDTNSAKPLFVALQGQDSALYGQIDCETVVWNGLHRLPARYTDLLHHDRVSLAHNNRSHLQMELHWSALHKPRDKELVHSSQKNCKYIKYFSLVNDRTVFRLPQLEIENSRTEDCTINYSTGTFTCLAAVFKLKRNPGYLFFSTYIPSVLIVIMSWISFWIPAESTPARVTLGVTSLLTLATQETDCDVQLRAAIIYSYVLDMR